MGVIVVTGAGGYLGRYTVAAARARGHEVRAVLRSERPVPETWQTDAKIVSLTCDLAQGDITQVLTGADAVIHAAASLTGDEAMHAVDTIAATERLVEAIAAADPRPQAVLASSLSVYSGLGPKRLVDEATPLESSPVRRDAYTRAKLAQEEIFRQAGNCWLVRLGAIYGPGRLWNGHLGPRLGPLLIRIGNGGEIPLVQVARAAEALILAAETRPNGPEPVNVVDDELPDRARFLKALGAARPRFSLPIPYGFMVFLARLAALLPGRKPGLLRLEVLAARMRPQRYTNKRAKDRLRWQAGTGFEAAMKAALREDGHAE
jgi:nucleoside-diphosphate-sugar epimerase